MCNKMKEIPLESLSSPGEKKKTTTKLLLPEAYDDGRSFSPHTCTHCPSPRTRGGNNNNNAKETKHGE